MLRGIICTVLFLGRHDALHFPRPSLRGSITLETETNKTGMDAGDSRFKDLLMSNPKCAGPFDPQIQNELQILIGDH